MRSRLASILIALAVAACAGTKPVPAVIEPVFVPAPVPMTAPEVIATTPAPKPQPVDKPAPLPSKKAKVIDRLVKVYYGTNRQPRSTEGTEGKFEDRPGNGVSYGTLTVSVPLALNHTPGEIERNWTLTGYIDPDTSFTMKAIRALPRDAMFALMREQLAAGNGKKDAFLFVHGFNVGFDQAAFRTAQIAHDIGFEGTPAFYSWPSENSLSPLAYSHDENRVEESRPLIKQFIADIIEKSGADRVFILAHSMGTRPTSAALAELARERPQLTAKVQALILAAPDINAATFRNDIAPVLTRMASTTTLYASSEDTALEWGNWLGGRKALGFVDGKLPTFPGMISVDISALQSSRFGHSEYAVSPELLADIAAITDNVPATSRRWLKPLDTSRSRFRLDKNIWCAVTRCTLPPRRARSVIVKRGD